jgi:hypothetical protein
LQEDTIRSIFPELTTAASAPYFEGSSGGVIEALKNENKRFWSGRLKKERRLQNELFMDNVAILGGKALKNENGRLQRDHHGRALTRRIRIKITLRIFG